MKIQKKIYLFFWGGGGGVMVDVKSSQVKFYSVLILNKES